MKREQINELYKLNRKVSRSIAELVAYIDESEFKNVNEFGKIVSYLINIDDILRSFDYEE